MIVENDCPILQPFHMGDGATGDEVPMDVMTLDVPTHQQAKHQAAREAQRMHAPREELAGRIAQAIRADGTAQPFQGLYLSRASTPLEPVYGVLEPSLCVIAQGSKEVLLGESRYRYDPAHYLLATVELPSVGQVLDASKERPYLSLRLELAPTLVSAVMVEAGQRLRAQDQMAVSSSSS
jgi:AraC-type transcriptional regulator N-terminus